MNPSQRDVNLYPCVSGKYLPMVAFFTGFFGSRNQRDNEEGNRQLRLFRMQVSGGPDNTIFSGLDGGQKGWGG